MTFNYFVVFFSGGNWDGLHVGRQVISHDGVGYLNSWRRTVGGYHCVHNRIDDIHVMSERFWRFWMVYTGHCSKWRRQFGAFWARGLILREVFTIVYSPP